MKRVSRKSIKQGTSRYQKWILVLTLSAIVLATLRFFVLNQKANAEKTTQSKKVALKADKIIDLVLKDYHIQEEWITRRQEGIRVLVPREFRFHNFYTDLSYNLHHEKIRVSNCSENLETNTIEIKITKNNKIIKTIFLKESKNLSNIAGYAAIIIDDFGYAYTNTVKEFIFFPYPINLSIIPGLPQTDKIKNETELAQKEYLIHMPMEPLNENVHDHGFTIMTDQTPGIIRLRVRSACSQLPNAKGMNNHQGSKATIDSRVMNIVLDELKFHGKFFIDSRTHSKSIALDVAQKIGLPALGNNLFLDVKNDKDYILAQMEKLADIAALHGKAVAIGHAKANTLKALKIAIPKLESRGIKFVPISDLISLDHLQSITR